MMHGMTTRCRRQGLWVVGRWGSVLLLAVFWMAWASAAKASPGQLLLNPSFETLDDAKEPVDWTLWARPGAITASSHAFVGQWALRVEPEAGKTYRASQQVKIQQAGAYNLRFHVQATGQARVHASWTLHDEQGQAIKVARYWTRTISAAQASGGWTPVATQLEVPANARELRLTFWFTAGQGEPAGEVYLDDVSLQPVQATTQPGDARPASASLVYEQSFDAGTSLEGWQVVSGDWSIRDQALHGRGRGIILYTGQGADSPNMRVEYTTWAPRQPGDLSALLAVDKPAPWGKLQGYFFGFGSRHNTTNTILRLAGGSTTLASQGGDLQTLEHGIIPGKRHRVIIQRIHNELQMFVDGRRVLEAHDMLYASFTGRQFGFYVWEEGYIDDIEVYALPWATTAAAPEVELLHQSHDAFEALARQPPAELVVDRGRPELSVVNMPTWVYKPPASNAIVDDHCLRIVARGDGSPVRLERAIEPLSSGIVEFDFLAIEHGEVRFALLDGQGGELLHVLVTESGHFAVDRPGGRQLLREKVRYQRRVFDADFRLLPGRWYTIRLQFLSGLAQIVLLDQYSEIDGDFGQGNMGDYMPLSSDPAFDMQSRQAATIAIELTGSNEVYLDNLIAFGPVGTQSVRGKPLTQSAISLLGLDAPLRKDPFQLKALSYRHLTRNNLRITPRLRLGDKAPGYDAFHQAGQRYNQHLIDLAFLEERCELLRRSVFYAQGQANHATLEQQLGQAQMLYQQAEQLQERALRAYADAYLDGQRIEALQAYDSLANQIAAAHEQLGAMIDRSLALLASSFPDSPVAATHRNPVRGKAVPGEVEWNASRRRWEKAGQPVVYPYFSQMPGTPHYWDDLQLLGFERPRDAGAAYQAFPFRRTDDITLHEGQYVDPAGANWQWLARLHEQGRKGLLRLAMGMNYAVTAAPPWWVKKHQDQDVFMVDRQGRRPAELVWREQYMLNWWHPAVQQMIDAQFAAVGRQANAHRDAITFVHAGWELKNTFPAGVAPGRNPSAVQAFRQMLEAQYQSIDKLNEAWATAYAAFDAIHPPAEDAPPSGLVHAFNKFVHAGFNDWLGRIGRSVSQQMPGVPIASDTQYTLGGRVGVEAIDPVGYFEAVDIKLYHTYQAWDRQWVDRWHGQLASAIGRAWGTMEWLISQGSPYMFQTELLRNNALRERAMQMIWGATLLEFYGFGFGNWQYEAGIHEPALDRMVFNYTAPLYPLSIARARRIGHAALNIPLAKPRIGLLETTSSYYNRLPARQGVKQLAIDLTHAGQDFEFLYEQLLLDGRQTLDATQMLIVPHGLCMPDELFNRITRWVEQGGTLVMAGGAMGAMNEHGQPATQRPSFFNAPLDDAAFPKRQADDTDEQGRRTWLASHGRGMIHLTSHISPQVAQLVETHHRPRVTTADRDLQFCLREQEGTLYLYLLNWSDARTIESDVVVQGRWTQVLDQGLEWPMQVPLIRQEQGIRFRVTLGPGQVTLLRLNP